MTTLYLFFVSITFIFCQGLPECQYAVYPDSPLISVIGACNGHNDGYSQQNVSYEYVCNETSNGVNQTIYDDYNCQGTVIATQDITNDLQDFNCKLPKCTDNAPTAQINIFANCTTKISDRLNLFTNQYSCIPYDNGSVEYSCQMTPKPSLTYTYFDSKDCGGIKRQAATFYDGCNDNCECQYYIEECSKPADTTLWKH